MQRFKGGGLKMAVLEQNQEYTFTEFEVLNESDDVKREFIDNKIYLLASPSTAHQEVSRELTVLFHPVFKKRGCKLLVAPFDVKLTKDDLEPQLVIPDLVVICDKSGLNEKRYEGVPTLIVEILSPSNQHHDLLTKMNLYAKFGVKEYWIVNPLTKSISIYKLDESQHYIQAAVKSSGKIQSKLFEELSVNVDELFDF